MNETPRPSPDDAPGHYGAGYGEQVPPDAPPRPAPATDSDAPLVLDVAAPEAGRDDATTTEGDDGEPVVFTPDDVSARPPDQPPTDAAPASEKAALIFERS